MEWSRVEIEMLGAGAPASPSLGVTMPGLDATAEEMHGLFLEDLPHLYDVHAGHDRVFSDVAAPVEMSKSLVREIQPLEELLREFGGSRSDHRIVIPLPSALSDGLIVEKLASGEGDIIRLIAPERFGGVLRKFEMPEGRRLTGASWEEGVLSLTMD